MSGIMKEPVNKDGSNLLKSSGFSALKSRKDRLKKALRDNLRKRKHQARRRKTISNHDI